MRGQIAYQYGNYDAINSTILEDTIDGEIVALQVYNDLLVSQNAKLGDYVTVTGTFSAYGQVPQLSSVTACTINSSAAAPAPQEYATFAAVLANKDNLLSEYLLLKNILAGIHGIDPAVVEAGRGMGMSELQILRRIQLPLAAPVIAAGLRLAILSTTGIAAIAACIQAGGLGVILFSGMRTMNVYKMVWGTIICVLLVFLEDGVLRILQRKICKEVH